MWYLRKLSNAILSFLILQNQAKSLKKNKKQFYTTDYAYNSKKLYLIPAKRGITIPHPSLLFAPLVYY